MRSRMAISAWFLASVVAGFIGLTAVEAQYPPRQAAPLPPLLFLRLAGPPGMKATLYRGDRAGTAFETPCVIGMRPGYGYRLALTNIAGFPGATFSPTIDIRGSLLLSHQLRNADFPVTLRFRSDDFAKVEKGALLKKIIVLENPETAEPAAARGGESLEFTVANAREMQHEIQARGAALAIVTLGERTFTPQELAESAVPGTMLFPGDKVLGPPRSAPWSPWTCFPVYDPIHGPASPAAYTTLFDGGDSGLRAGFDREGKLRGVDPTDTVAEYTDAKGRPRVVASNRVALCVPRFVILRSESGLASQTLTFGPGVAHVHQASAGVDQRLPLIERTQPLFLETAASRLKASGTEFASNVAVSGRINGLEIATTLRNVNTLDGACPPPATPTPDRPLRIIKWPDKKGCIVGDTVLFSLRYTNQGGTPITRVAVTDSLTTRFEYIPGSQKTDREATFTIQPNEAGSAFLRWEFPGALQPGESGLITFQVRIR